MISVQEFITAFKEAFTETSELPLAFWYDDEPVAETPKIPGCMLKVMDKARKGEPITFSADNISCFGGRYYAGYDKMSPYTATFVSQKEKFKVTPEMVTEYVKSSMEALPASKPYLNFLRIDRLESFDKMEGLLFIVRPNALCGLMAWAYYDNNDIDAVSTPWGSGCSSIITTALSENRRDGRRTFIGLTDLSVRPYFGPDELGFIIPRSRFLTMQNTIRQCFFFGVPAWQKLREKL